MGQEVTNDTAREELRGMRRGGKWERRQEGTDDTVKGEEREVKEDGYTEEGNGADSTKW